MSGKATIGIVTRDACNAYPTKSSRELARWLIATYPDVFHSEEHARSSIRWYRGKRDNGKSKVSCESYTPSFIAPPGAAEHAVPFELPAVPAIISGDWHVPYHDQDALETMVDFMLSKKIPMLVILGDGLDMYQVSSFSRDPTMFSAQLEVEMFSQIIRDIRNATGCSIVFKEGNHEQRFDRHLMQASPEAFKFSQTHLRALIDPEALGITYVTAMQPIYFRGLTMVHGHEIGKSANNPVSPARGLILKTKKSSVCAHWHRSSEQPANDIRGGQQTGWSIGCMCGLHPDYMPFNDWNHGFGELEADGEEFFTFTNHKIIKGRVV